MAWERLGGRSKRRWTGSALLLAFLLGVGGIVPSVGHAGWVDEWLSGASEVRYSSGVVESQKRHYWMGGGRSLRWQVEPVSPIVSIQPPRLSVGCGGIDIFWGGINFMKLDYLVKKFQSVVVNAAAVAFHIGLNLLCTPCSTISNTIENIENFLNSLQQDACSMGTKLAHKMTEGAFTEAVQSVATKYSAASFFEAVEDWSGSLGKPDPDDVKDTTSDCNTEFLQLVFGAGSYNTAAVSTKSLLNNIIIASGLTGGSSFGKALPIVRGLVGDIFIRTGGEAGVAIVVKPPCSQNKNISIVDWVLNGNSIQEMDDTGTCTTVTPSTSLVADISAKLDSLYNKILNKQALTAAEENFMLGSSIPVYVIVQNAIASGTYFVVKETLAQYLAYEMAASVLGDAAARAHFLIAKAQEIIHSGGTTSGGDGGKCVPWYKPELEDAVSAYAARLDKLNRDITEWKAEAQETLVRHNAAVESFRRIAVQVRDEISRRFGASVSGRVFRAL